MNKTKITSWDFDGTLTTGQFVPKSGDVIVTGRCFDEASIVINKLKDLGIVPLAIYFNTLPLSVRGDHSEDARVKSAMHKVDVLTKLSVNCDVVHYDDDPIQIKILKDSLPQVEVVEVPNIQGKFYADN